MIHDNCAICRREPDVAFVSSISTDVIYLPEKKSNCISLLLCALAVESTCEWEFLSRARLQMYVVQLAISFFLFLSLITWEQIQFCFWHGFCFFRLFPVLLEKMCSTDFLLMLSKAVEDALRKPLLIACSFPCWKLNYNFTRGCSGDNGKCSGFDILPLFKAEQKRGFNNHNFSHAAFHSKSAQKGKICATKILSNRFVSLHDTKPVRMFFFAAVEWRSLSRRSPRSEEEADQ